MKDNSEPTGSPAPVIQHSSLAHSPSAGQNGLSSRAAAEAMAMSVLAGMGQQQRAESGPSHIIMAAQSQSAARWWAMPPRPRIWLYTCQPGVKKSSGLPQLPQSRSPDFSSPSFAVLLRSLWPSCRVIMLWPGAQQQPSGNGLRLLRELPVHFAIDYRGWTPTYPILVSPPLCFLSPLSSPSVKRTPHWTVKLYRSERTAVKNCPCWHIPHMCTVSNTQLLHKRFWSNQIPNNPQGCKLFSAGNSALCSSTC